MVFVKISHLAVAYLLFKFFHYVNGLRCFECTMMNKGCGDPIRREYIEQVDCQYSTFTFNVETKKHSNEDLFRCLKTVEKNSTNLLYTRRCALKEEEVICNTEQKTSQYNFTMNECSICEKDLCNSSTMVKLVSFYSYVVSAVIIVLFPTNKV